MSIVRRFLFDLVTKEEGPTAVEYAVMLALIIVGCVAALFVIGEGSSGAFSSAGDGLSGS